MNDFPDKDIVISRSVFSSYFFINDFILVQSLITIPCLAEVANTLLLSHKALPISSCTKTFCYPEKETSDTITFTSNFLS